MDKEHLSDAIGDINDDYVKSADIKQKNNKTLKVIISLAAVLALAITAVYAIPKLMPSNVTPGTSQTAEKDISEDGEKNTEPSENTTNESGPEADYLSYAEIIAEYPDFKDGITWRDESEDSYNISFEDARSFSVDFYKDIIGEFLGDKTDENAALSPMSIFFSLASLAEITQGETREQILSLLGTKSAEQARDLAKATWLNIYSNGVSYEGPEENDQLIIPANSFWLNQNAELSGNADIGKILKNDHFTSFYKGDPSDKNYVNAFRSWLNKHTGGLLEDFAEKADFSPEEIFKLVNTVLLEVSWMQPFNKDNSFTGDFYTQNGVSSAEYMFREYDVSGRYYENDDFSAVSIGTKSHAEMWFILPENGNTVYSLINSGSYAGLINELKDKNSTAFDPPEGYDLYCIQYTIPKFDITSEYHLPEKLAELGVTDAFDAEKADIPFITMKDGSNIYITDATQDVRVKIDEQGISAAAATVMVGGTGEPVFKYIDFTADRPFMFLITSDGAPLFAGVVNEPGK